jgi:hypothetical protein
MVNMRIVANIRRSAMKKMLVMISLLVGVLVLVFSVEPCLSQALKEEFSGYRVRTKQVQPDVKIFACRNNVDNQEAWWTITVNNPLVDGKWYNWDTKLRRSIVEYTMPTGQNIPCDPSEDPPEGFKGVVNGDGIVFGPFTLVPDGAEGGIWTGMWKIQFYPDGSRLQTAEAKGQGGLLEGRSLHILTRSPAPVPTRCDCPICPSTGSNLCFEGWILTPGVE